MPRKPKQMITAWSHSRKSDYDHCAFKAKLKHLDKVKEPQNDAMKRGQEVDNAACDFVKGVTSQLHPALKNFEAEFRQLRKIKKIVKLQEQVTLNQNWKPTELFASDAWLRMKFDASYMMKGRILKIIDFKTGKKHDENRLQLDLYGVGGLVQYEGLVDEVHAELWYLDQGEIDDHRAPGVPAIYTPDMLPTEIKRWVKDTKKMLSDFTFKPTPSKKCEWCFYGQSGKAKGGPGLCKF